MTGDEIERAILDAKEAYQIVFIEDEVWIIQHESLGVLAMCTTKQKLIRVYTALCLRDVFGERGLIDDVIPEELN